MMKWISPGRMTLKVKSKFCMYLFAAEQISFIYRIPLIMGEIVDDVCEKSVNP